MSLRDRRVYDDLFFIQMYIFKKNQMKFQVISFENLIRQIPTFLKNVKMHKSTKSYTKSKLKKKKGLNYYPHFLPEKRRKNELYTELSTLSTKKRQKNLCFSKKPQNGCFVKNE